MNTFYRLYNIFIKEFRGNIEKAIQKAVSSQVSKQVNEQLEKVISSLNLDFPVGHYGITGDFSFRTVKFAAQNYMRFVVKFFFTTPYIFFFYNFFFIINNCVQFWFSW